jgi:hypothetical protein
MKPLLPRPFVWSPLWVSSLRAFLGLCRRGFFAEAESFPELDLGDLAPASVIAEAKRLPLGGEKEVWQFLCPRLSCLVPSREKDESFVRPFVMVLVSLFPAGRVIAHRIPSPPHAVPSFQRILAFCLEAMKHPSSGDPHRPAQVVFSSKYLASGLKHSLSVCGVGCGVLSAPPDLSEHLLRLSQRMVEQGLASDGASPTKESLSDAHPRLSVGALRAFADAQAWVRRFRPWRVLADRVSLRVRLLGREAPPPVAGKEEEEAWRLCERFWGEHDPEGVGRGCPMGWIPGTWRDGRGGFVDLGRVEGAGWSGGRIVDVGARVGETVGVEEWRSKGGRGLSLRRSSDTAIARCLRGPVWVSAMGHTSESDGPGQRTTLGVAVFRSRWDAEQRSMGAVSPTAEAVSNPVDHRCGWCGRDAATASLRRCGRCRGAYYCADGDCQRRDWAEGRHRERCVSHPRRSDVPRWFGDGELVTLFVPGVSAPLSDVAAMEGATLLGRLEVDDHEPVSLEASVAPPVAPADERLAPFAFPEPPEVARMSVPVPLAFQSDGRSSRPDEAELMIMTVSCHVLLRWLVSFPDLAVGMLPTARETLVVLRSDASLPAVPCRRRSDGTVIACEDEAAAKLAVEAAPATSVTSGRVAMPRGGQTSLAASLTALGLPMPPPLPPWMDGMVVSARLDPFLTKEEVSELTGKPSPPPGVRDAVAAAVAVHAEDDSGSVSDADSLHREGATSPSLEAVDESMEETLHEAETVDEGCTVS